jgi:hypothetical protein
MSIIKKRIYGYYYYYYDDKLGLYVTPEGKAFNIYGAQIILSNKQVKRIKNFFKNFNEKGG